ncbi:hypothetical protein [Microvirga puerhi]|uniref:Uncharacterized protein n=1 Tax=Microvirga puerhi TaxID=2876078 RepID=A0ABS7VMF5_9HYPH|nr:hypothetical protein [Microvirga puerhi]MBZ6076118.1 hypothetical protein [Microvirga puerhi]
MDGSYSVIADVLNKFHTSSDAIQALWLIAMAVTVLGIASLVTQVLREALRSRRPAEQRRAFEGELLYGLYRDPQGQVLLYRHGERDGVSLSELPLPDKVH